MKILNDFCAVLQSVAKWNAFHVCVWQHDLKREADYGNWQNKWKESDISASLSNAKWTLRMDFQSKSWTPMRAVNWNVCGQCCGTVRVNSDISEGILNMKLPGTFSLLLQVQTKTVFSNQRDWKVTHFKVGSLTSTRQGYNAYKHSHICGPHSFQERSYTEDTHRHFFVVQDCYSTTMAGGPWRSVLWSHF